MKIEGTPKEIADFVLEVQNRQFWEYNGPSTPANDCKEPIKKENETCNITPDVVSGQACTNSHFGEAKKQVAY